MGFAISSASMPRMATSYQTNVAERDESVADQSQDLDAASAQAKTGAASLGAVAEEPANGTRDVCEGANTRRSGMQKRLALMHVKISHDRHPPRMLPQLLMMMRRP